MLTMEITLAEYTATLRAARARATNEEIALIYSAVIRYFTRKHIELVHRNAEEWIKEHNTATIPDDEWDAILARSTRSAWEKTRDTYVVEIARKARLYLVMNGVYRLSQKEGMRIAAPLWAQGLAHSIWPQAGLLVEALANQLESRITTDDITELEAQETKRAKDIILACEKATQEWINSHPDWWDYFTFEGLR